MRNQEINLRARKNWGLLRVYREWLNHICQEDDWTLGAAALTIFIKGTPNDPEEVLYPRPAQNQAEIEDLIKKYALVQHHGLSLECMDYVRAQYMFAPGARKVIYDMITQHATETTQQYHFPGFGRFLGVSV